MLHLQNDKLLRRQIYEYLQTLLSKGFLRPGETISLNKIAESMSVGRTPLRDALLELQAEGLVVFLPQRGIMIREFDLEEMVKLYEVYGALEAQVMNKVFPLLGEAEVNELETLNKNMWQCMSEGQYKEFVALNNAFHDVFIKIAQNEIMVGMMKLMRRRLFEFSWDKWTTRWGEKWRLYNCKEHDEIIKLIKEKNATACADFLKNVHWTFNWESDTA